MESKPLKYDRQPPLGLFVSTSRSLQESCVIDALMDKGPVTPATGGYWTCSKRQFDVIVDLLKVSSACTIRRTQSYANNLPLDQADNGSWIILMSTSCKPAAVIRLASLGATLKSLRSSKALI
jgi:hypothetical protein